MHTQGCTSFDCLKAGESRMVEDGLNYWNCYKGFNFLQPAPSGSTKSGNAPFSIPFKIRTLFIGRGTLLFCLVLTLLNILRGPVFAQACDQSPLELQDRNFPHSLTDPLLQIVKTRFPLGNGRATIQIQT